MILVAVRFSPNIEDGIPEMSANETTPCVYDYIDNFSCI